MKPLNYTTKKTVSQTINDILQLLSKVGCTKIEIDYKEGEPTGIIFAVPVLNNFLRVQMPCKFEGTLNRLRRSNQKATLQDAKKIAWRTLYNWIEVNLELVFNEQAELIEVFLPYVLNEQNQTVFNHFLQDKKIVLLA